MIAIARSGLALLAVTALLPLGTQYLADRNARERARAGEAAVDEFLNARFTADRLRWIAADPRRTGEFLALVEASCEHRALRADCVSFARSGVLARWTAIRAESRDAHIAEVAR